jgi:hypothetical protein
MLLALHSAKFAESLHASTFIQHIQRKIAVHKLLHLYYIFFHCNLGPLHQSFIAGGLECKQTAAMQESKTKHENGFWEGSGKGVNVLSATSEPGPTDQRPTDIFGLLQPLRNSQTQLLQCPTINKNISSDLLKTNAEHKYVVTNKLAKHRSQTNFGDFLHRFQPL